MTPRLLYYKPHNRLSQSDLVVLDCGFDFFTQFFPLLGVDVVHDDVGMLNIVHVATQEIDHSILGKPQGTVTSLLAKVSRERQNVDLEPRAGVVLLLVALATT